MTKAEMRERVMAGDLQAFYGSREWKRKREQIKQRDHYLCQRCLGKFGSVEHTKFSRVYVVHHIVPMLVDFDKAFDDDNLISLCFDCHEAVEGRKETFRKANNEHKKEPLTVERW